MKAYRVQEKAEREFWAKAWASQGNVHITWGNKLWAMEPAAAKAYAAQLLNAAHEAETLLSPDSAVPSEDPGGTA